MMCGCGPHALMSVGITSAAGAASIVLIHRTPIDVAYSLISGRDCSIVNLDRLQDYCRPSEALPLSLPYCTRGLGNVDCWIDPPSDFGRPVADQPALTAEQNARVRGSWSILGN